MKVCLSTRPLSRCAVMLSRIYGAHVTRLRSGSTLINQRVAVKKVIADIHQKVDGGNGPCNVTGVRSCSNSTRLPFFNGS